MRVFRIGMASVREYIERLGPDHSFLLLAIPTGVVEPLKLIAVAVAGEGHWITGTAIVIAAYAKEAKLSRIKVERAVAKTLSKWT